MKESILRLYKAKSRRKPLPLFIKRGQTKVVEIKFKNTGEATWYDIGRTGKVPEGHKPVVVKYAKENTDYFRVKIGEKAEKTDLKFKKALDKYGKEKDIRHIVHPGETVLVAVTITAKKFTIKGLYKLRFRLHFKDEDASNFGETTLKLKLYSFNLKSWLKAGVKTLQLILMKPGKTTYSVTNESFESKASDAQPVIMCTWKRLDNLPKTIEMLSKQTKPTVLYIWNNNKNIRKQIDQIVRKEKKLPIKVYHSTFNIGGFGRFIIAKKIPNQYSIFIDDDQNFATDTVSKLLKEAKPKTIVSQWAFNFTDLNYWNKDLTAAGEKADYCGTAGMIIDNEIFKNKEVYNCPKRYWFIEDLWLSYVAKYLFKWELRKSNTEINLDEDGKDQMYGLVDKKAKFLRHLSKKLNKQKVFGVGLPKTGTTSLSAALEILGYSSIHYPRTLEQISFYESASDSLVAINYKELDRLYPGSKFILTIRDIQKWLSSNQRHDLKIKTPKIGSKAYRLRLESLGSINYDKDKLTKKFNNHMKDVRKYFKNRPDDLLVIDLTQEEQVWSKLCAFLNKPIPKQHFPKKNVNSKDSIKYGKSLRHKNEE